VADAEDAERHLTLLQANVDDPLLTLAVQAVDPELLRLTAQETDHACCVQRRGSLLMPPQRMLGATEDLRGSLEHVYLHAE
jgi:hypothetical protein